MFQSGRKCAEIVGELEKVKDLELEESEDVRSIAGSEQRA
jgi:hypothetical protein